MVICCIKIRARRACNGFRACIFNREKEGNMDILEILNFIIKMVLVGGAVLIGTFILAVIVGSVRELVKLFISGPDTKGKK
nr:MAG TPA: hypothetical protein [Caudoviricetes sp.]